MSNYKRIASRLLILSTLVVGAITLKPTPAMAFNACQTACFNDYRTCLASGAAGCDANLTDCLSTC